MARMPATISKIFGHILVLEFSDAAVALGLCAGVLVGEAEKVAGAEVGLVVVVNLGVGEVADEAGEVLAVGDTLGLVVGDGVGDAAAVLFVPGVTVGLGLVFGVEVVLALGLGVLCAL